MNSNSCRICGLHIENKPWGEDGHSPTYEICPCCGVEFGYEDDTVESADRYRNQWIQDGCNWFRPEEKPAGWRFL